MVFCFPRFFSAFLNGKTPTNFKNTEKETNMDKTQEALITTSAESALYRQSTNIAGLCKEIVLKSAVTIQGRKYVRVEGWMSIATAHGCIATIKSVEEIPTGVLAVAEIRRQSDGCVLTTAEGFVGKDESTWYGGEVERWNRSAGKLEKVTMPKRLDYAIRAMAQTRAVSRACRTAFAHVVVLMDAGLDTTPAEEANEGLDDEGLQNVTPKADPKPSRPEMQADPLKEAGETNSDLESREITKEQLAEGRWKEVVIHFGTNYKGKKLGELSTAQLRGWMNWQPKPFGNKGVSEDDRILRLALDVAAEEVES